MDGCPKCGNKMGFACGTCIDCGFNYLSNTYDWIKVWRTDLDALSISFEDKYALIKDHDKYVTRFNKK